MIRCASFVFGLIFLCVATLTAAETVKSGGAAETLMCERGKLRFSDDFDKPLSKPWRVAKGKWEIAGGAVRGSELKADKHGAVLRTNLPLHDAVIQYSVKLEGTKTTTFSINAAGFTARKDDHDHAGPDKAAVLQAVKTPIGDGQWHALVIEINDSEFLARLDGKHMAYGLHDAIDVDKTNIGLTDAGHAVTRNRTVAIESRPVCEMGKGRSRHRCS